MTLPDVALGDLLAAPDPWPVIHALAERWDDALAAACARGLAHADDGGRRRILWLVAGVAAPSAHAVLLAQLPRARDRELAQILSVLTRAGVVVPTAEIMRAFDEAPDEAAAAAVSRDPALVPRLGEQLGGERPSWKAALALAVGGRRALVDAILRGVRTRERRDATGFVVALEALGEARAVAALRALLAEPDAPAPWELGHALFALTGREPLVALNGDARAEADAWHAYDLDAPPRPRLEQVELAADRATFALVDGAAAISIDYGPPTQGSSWPQWGLWLRANGKPLYAIGSGCDTCETTLRAMGDDPSIAARIAREVRACLGDLRALDVAVLDALTPCLARLRTGHYLIALVDLAIEVVDAADRSWLTRRTLHRGADPAPRSSLDVSWPGAPHFQVRDAALGEVPTYGLLLPTQALAALDEPTIAAHAAAIESGARPTALAMAWLEAKDVEAEYPERFLIGAILDGHHRLAAYARLCRPARILLACRLEDSPGPPEDRASWLRAAIADLAAAPLG
ncbi:MAG: hypothetical protein K8W52_06980 [Deltaproteobacteria bacterium]|nr:hypothetical protein [Deltaproteobacteria bacterium]